MWWDSIDKAGSRDGTTTGLPCCPRCGGVLFEVPNEKEWWAGVDQHQKNGNPGYRAFIEWLRGKCFADMETAKNEYAKANLLG